MLESVEYGNSLIKFEVKRSNRKTLGISVLPCGMVEVTAPENAPITKIKEIVHKRGSWLLEQKRQVGYNPILQPPKSFISGESYYLLGRHYRLKVFEANYDSIDVLDDRLIMNCSFPEDIDLKRSLMLNWYLNMANKVVSERFNHLVSKYGHEDFALVVKKLSKRWGEFHPNKNMIVLNAELIVAPIECIDYVITHELCHSIHLEHGPEFSKLLSYRLPNWKELKNTLETHANGFEPIIRKNEH